MQAKAFAFSDKIDFSPWKAFSLETVRWSTANHRGFWCDYKIEEKLIIINLHLVTKDLVYPPLMNVLAEEDPIYKEIRDRFGRNIPFPMQYSNIDYEVDYTGKMVLGIDFDRSQDDRYKQVLELGFEHGILMDTIDITTIRKASKKKDIIAPDDIWWMKEKNDYYYRLNYGDWGKS